jgi:hypothetical protein
VRIEGWGVFFLKKNKTTADTSTVKNELISHRKTPYVGSQQAATKQYVTLCTHQVDMTLPDEIKTYI